MEIIIVIQINAKTFNVGHPDSVMVMAHTCNVPWIDFLSACYYHVDDDKIPKAALSPSTNFPCYPYKATFEMMKLLKMHHEGIYRRYTWSAIWCYQI